jgi:hypothetical protein
MTVRRSLATLAAALSLTLAVNGAVFAEPGPQAQAAYDRGLAAHRAGDLPGAVVEWEEAAKQGHVAAAWILGNLYDKGAGVPKSDAKAYEYYLQATRGGQPEAAVRLGQFYLEDNEAIGLKRNYAAALKAFEVGALAARGDAQYYLGIMHRRGWGTAVDRTESLRWLILSSKKRYAPALAELGRIYMEGEGVERDRADGWAYFLLANRYGNDDQRAEANDYMARYDNLMKRSEKDEASKRVDAWVSAFGGS